MPDFHMLPAMKTMFQRCFRAVSTGVCPYRQKSDFLSIAWSPRSVGFAGGWVLLFTGLFLAIILTPMLYMIGSPN